MNINVFWYIAMWHLEISDWLSVVIYCLHVSYPNDVGSKLLLNLGNELLTNMESYPRRLYNLHYITFIFTHTILFILLAK